MQKEILFENQKDKWHVVGHEGQYEERGTREGRVPSTASCELEDRPLCSIQNSNRSSAMSDSTPWSLALLQKYVSQAFMCISSKHPRSDYI